MGRWKYNPRQQNEDDQTTEEQDPMDEYLDTI